MERDLPVSERSAFSTRLCCYDPSFSEVDANRIKVGFVLLLIGN